MENRSLLPLGSLIYSIRVPNVLQEQVVGKKGCLRESRVSCMSEAVLRDAAEIADGHATDGPEWNQPFGDEK